MAKFCKNCGSPLDENGKCPNCDKETKQEVKEEVKLKIDKSVEEVDDSESRLSTQQSEVGQTIGEIIKNIFKKPKTVIEKYSTEKNYIVGLIGIVIASIIGGLSTEVSMKALFKLFGKDLSTTRSGLTTVSNGADNLLGSLTNNSVNLNIKGYFSLIFGTFIKFFGISLLLFAIIIGMIYLVNTVVYKKKTNIKKVVSAVGIASFMYSIGMLVALILGFINYFLYAILAILVTIAFLVLIHLGIDEVTKLNSNKSTYVKALSIGAYTIVNLLFKMTLYVQAFILLALMSQM